VSRASDQSRGHQRILTVASGVHLTPCERVGPPVDVAAHLDLARLVGGEPAHDHHLLAQTQVAQRARMTSVKLLGSSSSLHESRASERQCRDPRCGSRSTRPSSRARRWHPAFGPAPKRPLRRRSAPHRETADRPCVASTVAREPPPTRRRARPTSAIHRRCRRPAPILRSRRRAASSRAPATSDDPAGARRESHLSSSASLSSLVAKPGLGKSHARAVAGEHDEALVRIELANETSRELGLRLRASRRLAMARIDDDRPIAATCAGVIPPVDPRSAGGRSTPLPRHLARRYRSPPP